MRALRRVWAVGIPSIVLMAAAPQLPPFQASVDLVRLQVVVLDRAGDPVPRLREADFEVFENGSRQVVSSFAEGRGDGRVPLHLGLMLDKSRSMDLDIKAASNAAVKFISLFTEARDVTLVDFDSGVRLGQFVPENYPYLFERIRQLKLGWGTALYDAMSRYLETVRTRDGQHILVIYSDGGDSRSGSTFNNLVNRLRDGNVIVYAIGYVENQSPTARVQQQSILNRMAHETGGEAFFPASASDLDRIYGRILAEIASRYTIGYVPSDPRTDGRFRRVDVRLARDLKGVRVRTRSGYVSR